MPRKKTKDLQTYPKCPLCDGEQTQFPPDLFGPCKKCISYRPEEVKHWREEQRARKEAKRDAQPEATSIGGKTKTFTQKQIEKRQQAVRDFTPTPAPKPDVPIETLDKVEFLRLLDKQQKGEDIPYSKAAMNREYNRRSILGEV